jgi:hypothetical protein
MGTFGSFRASAWGVMVLGVFSVGIPLASGQHPPPPASDEIVNQVVTLSPLEETFRVRPSGGCPSTFNADFSFDARLRNLSHSHSLTDLVVEVEMLTNGGLLQNALAGPNGEGALWMAPLTNGFSNGELSPGESVVVPFIICFREEEPFTSTEFTFIETEPFTFMLTRNGKTRFILSVNVLVVRACKTPIKALGIASDDPVGTCVPDPCGPCRAEAFRRAAVKSTGVCQVFNKPAALGGGRCRAIGATVTRQGFVSSPILNRCACTCESEVTVDCDP